MILFIIIIVIVIGLYIREEDTKRNMPENVLKNKKLYYEDVKKLTLTELNKNIVNGKYK